MLEINSDNFKKEIANSKIPVLLDCWSEWCGPCKQLAPIFDKVSEYYKTKVKFAKVDVQTNQEIAAENGVSGIPCLIFFNKGEEVDRLIGFRDESQLKKEIDELLGKV